MERFESKSVFVLELRTFKVGFSGPKTFRGFRETGPRYNIGTDYAGNVMELGPKTLTECQRLFRKLHL